MGRELKIQKSFIQKDAYIIRHPKQEDVKKWVLLNEEQKDG